MEQEIGVVDTYLGAYPALLLQTVANHVHIPSCVVYSSPVRSRGSVPDHSLLSPGNGLPVASVPLHTGSGGVLGYWSVYRELARVHLRWVRGGQNDPVLFETEQGVL